MKAKNLIIASLVISIALLIGLTTTTLINAKPKAEGENIKKVNLVSSDNEAGGAEAGETSGSNVGFPYTANGLLLFSFSVGLILVLSAFGMKTFFSRKY